SGARHRQRPAEGLPGKSAPWTASSSQAEALQDSVEPSEAWSPVRPGAPGQRRLQIPRASTVCRDAHEAAKRLLCEINQRCARGHVK
ncbi:hypothetical protein Celaphus_00019371, partial [Cervus elaphus hippelaphus]